MQAEPRPAGGFSPRGALLGCGDAFAFSKQFKQIVGVSHFYLEGTKQKKPTSAIRTRRLAEFKLGGQSPLSSGMRAFRLEARSRVWRSMCRQGSFASAVLTGSRKTGSRPIARRSTSSTKACGANSADSRSHRSRFWCRPSGDRRKFL